MQLEHEFTCRTSVVGPRVVGPGPSGLRHYYEVTGGEIVGHRLNGRTLGAGADWMLLAEDGMMHMDVRLQIETQDGAVLCVRYAGPAEPTEKLKAAMAAGQPTEFTDQYIRTVWTMESGDPRYAWVNRSVFVGEARFVPDAQGVAGFEHRVSRVG